MRIPQEATEICCKPRPDAAKLIKISKKHCPIEARMDNDMAWGRLVAVKMLRNW